jgi:hypothetical protein
VLLADLAFKQTDRNPRVDLQPVWMSASGRVTHGALNREARRVLGGLSATLPEPPGDSAIWFDSGVIIDHRPNPLPAAKVSFDRLNRDMSQQELDLLQFAS